MATSLRRILAASLTTCTVLNAQRTWVVDDSGGPGVDFTDLPPAIAAAAAGDDVVVHAGIYEPVTITRAIRLIGLTGAVVRPRSFTAFEFVIRGIPAGESCSISGLEFRGQSSANRFRIEACPGYVAIADCSVRHPIWVPSIIDCAAVSLIGCSMDTGLSIARSAVSAVQCAFSGYAGNSTAPPTIFAGSSELDLTACSVRGLDAQLSFYGTDAVALLDSHMKIRSQSGIYAGANSPRASITASGLSHVTSDPRVVLVPGPGGIPFVRMPLPALRARSYRLGTTLSIQVETADNNLYAVFAALPTPPFSLPWGRQWMDLATEVLLVAGVQPIGGTTVPLAIPAIPGLEGRIFTFQSLAGPALNDMSMSNPLTLVLRR